MTPSDITRTWTWTGDRDIPDWLTGHHHWHHDRPVIHTVDGPRHLYTGWLVALWTDGVITVGSNTVADRVYGPDGIAGRLKRAEAAIAAITSHLDIGDAQAWCKYCRRAWNSPAHRCESDGEQRVQRIAELRDRWLAAGPPPLGTSINRWLDKRLVELHAVLNEEQPGPA